MKHLIWVIIATCVISCTSNNSANNINVIDYENLTTHHAEYVNDFPHGGGRFTVKSTGYDATIVAGQVVVRNCEHTGSRPSEVIREFIRG